MRVFVQGLSVRARARERLVMVACREPCDPWSFRRIQPASQGRQHHGDPAREGVFKRERGGWRRAVKVVRQAGPRKVWMRSAWPCLPSPKSRVDLIIADAEVGALRVGTGQALGVHALGGSSLAFHLAPGTRHPQALHPTRQGRRDDRRGHRLGSGASGDDGASCAWPFLVRRKVEDGTSKDAKAAPERAGGRSRARTRTHEGPERSSLFEMGRRESSIYILRKEKESLPCSQASGRVVRIVHHRVGQYRWHSRKGQRENRSPRRGRNGDEQSAPARKGVPAPAGDLDGARSQPLPQTERRVEGTDSEEVWMVTAE